MSEGNEKSISVKIRNPRNENSADGNIQVQFWDKKERNIRALKFWGICWGLALVSIFIPMLHFVLVPGFILAGPIVWFFVLGQESAVLGGEGTCPHCQAAFKIAKSAYKFPMSDVCNACHENVKIEPVESA
jgi:hypothetical protein